MFELVFYVVFLAIIIFLILAVHYQLFLATAYFIVRDPNFTRGIDPRKFAIIVPAHNEELLIEKVCESLLNTDYPERFRKIFIIADNCTDSTAKKCSLYPVRVLIRNDTVKLGKGYALEWAFDQINLDDYDALLIVDADTTVDPTVFMVLNRMIEYESKAIQCNIKIPNRYESWVTQLMHLSRTVNNLLYHYPKYKMGLSSYLMGTGMCFTTDLIKKIRWTAFTLSEDWEYFALLIKRGIKIDFAVHGIVFQQESRSLRQATTQRLRWSKGRFYVVRALGVKLFFQGLWDKNWVMTDASLALIFPNWSLLVNSILIVFGLSLILPSGTISSISIIVSIEMVAIQALILALGVFLSGDVSGLVKAILMSPIFLVWKCIIDILSITGIYRGKRWIRTERHIPQ